MARGDALEQDLEHCTSGLATANASSVCVVTTFESCSGSDDPSALERRAVLGLGPRSRLDAITTLGVGALTRSGEELASVLQGLETWAGRVAELVER